MIGIILNLPPAVETYFAITPVDVMAAHALLLFGWIPMFFIIIWGMTHVWLDYKQEKYAHHLHYVLLEINVPQTAIQTPKGMDNFFTNLAGARSSITWREKWLLGKEQPVFSFEIASNEGSVHFYIRCIDRYRDLVEADLYAQYPEAQITEVEDYVASIPHHYPDDEWEAFGSEFVLSKPQYFPIRTYEDFEHQGEKDGKFKDPLFSILELMGKMRAGENYWMQILIRPPNDQSWIKEGMKYVGTVMGKEEKHKSTMMQDIGDAMTALPMGVVSQLTGLGAGGDTHEKKADDFRVFKLTPAEKAQIEGVTDKISKLGWQTKIRVLYSAKKPQFRKGMMAAGMKGMMHAFSNLVLNQFGMHNPSIPKDDYFWMAWQYPGKQGQLTRRYAKRALGAGATLFILNTEELATLFHFPAADARTPVLSSLGARRAEAPNVLSYAPEGDAEMMDWKKQYGQSKETERELDASGLLGGGFNLPTPPAPTAPVHPHLQAPPEGRSQPPVPHDYRVPEPEAGQPTTGRNAEPPPNLPV